VSESDPGWRLLNGQVNGLVGQPCATSAQKRLSGYGRYEQKEGVFGNWPKSLVPHSG
jgi:hypothetical protein